MTSHIIWAKMREKMTLHNVWKADWLISPCALTWYHLRETDRYQLVSILLLQAFKDDELPIHIIYIAQCRQKLALSLKCVFQAYFLNSTSMCTFNLNFSGNALTYNHRLSNISILSDHLLFLKFTLCKV